MASSSLASAVLVAVIALVLVNYGVVDLNFGGGGGDNGDSINDKVGADAGTAVPGDAGEPEPPLHPPVSKPLASGGDKDAAAALTEKIKVSARCGACRRRPQTRPTCQRFSRLSLPTDARARTIALSLSQADVSLSKSWAREQEEQMHDVAYTGALDRACGAWDAAKTHAALNGAEAPAPAELRACVLAAAKDIGTTKVGPFKQFITVFERMLSANPSLSDVTDEQRGRSVVAWTAAVSWSGAQRERYTQVAEVLLSAGADPNARDADGFVAAHYAARYGNGALIRLLHARGADLDALDGQGLTPLHHACQADMADAAMVLLKNGAAVADNEDARYGAALPLYFALAAAKRLPAVALRLLDGAAPSVALLKQRGTWPVLLVMPVADGFDEDVGMRLLELDADRALTDRQRRALLQEVVAAGYHAFAEELLSRTSDRVLLMPLPVGQGVGAGSAGSSAKAHQQQQGGKYGGGSTLMHAAARAGSVRLVNKLASRGLDVNARDTDGRTPLHVTLLGRGHAHVALELLERQVVDQDAKTNRGLTPLHFSASKDQLNGVTRKLVARGANVDVRDAFDLTPLHAAAEGGVIEVIELLLAAGASIDAREIDQYTPLISAAENGRVDACRLLVERGADVSAKNADGHDAVQVALTNGHKKAAEAIKVASGGGKPDASADVKQRKGGAAGADAGTAPPSEKKPPRAWKKTDL